MFLGPERMVDNLATSICRLCRNFESLRLLEGKQPVHVCTGLALPLSKTGYYYYYYYYHHHI
jgi:hypothetical protein